MDATVAVALIASLSTLSGAALTGLLTAWVNGRQLRHQLSLAREQRIEDRTDRSRQLRRDAYEKLLTQADVAYRVLDDAWLASPFTGYPTWKAGFAARRMLDEAAIRVRLEGPHEVAEQATALIRSIGDEFRLHRRVLDSTDDAAASAADLDRSARVAALDERDRATSAFLSAARAGLGPVTTTTTSD